MYHIRSKYPVSRSNYHLSGRLITFNVGRAPFFENTIKSRIFSQSVVILTPPIRNQNVVWVWFRLFVSLKKREFSQFGKGAFNKLQVVA